MVADKERDKDDFTLLCANSNSFQNLFRGFPALTFKIVTSPHHHTVQNISELKNNMKKILQKVN